MPMPPMKRGPESFVVVSARAPCVDGALARMAPPPLAGKHANDRPAVGTRSQGTSGGGGGMQPGGSAVPGGRFAGQAIGPGGLGFRVAQVPAAAFRWTRIPVKVFVTNRAPEYELTL